MRELIKVLKTLTAVSFFTLICVSISPAVSDFKTIDTVQLHSMIVDNAYRLEAGREKRCTVIDARTREEYDEAHIFSAISIPEKDFDKLTDFLPKDKGALLVVYCNDKEIETSKRWAEKAAAAGYTNIALYLDGFQVWKANKMPIAPLKVQRAVSKE